MVVYAIVLALTGQRQEDPKFEVSLDYTVRLCLKKIKDGPKPKLF
jgi:hypothetical protein